MKRFFRKWFAGKPKIGGVYMSDDKTRLFLVLDISDDGIVCCKNLLGKHFTATVREFNSEFELFTLYDA